MAVAKRKIEETNHRAAKLSPQRIIGKVVTLTPRKIDLTVEIEKNCLNEEEREQYVMNFREKGRKIARSILRKWQSRLDLEEIQSLVDLSLCEAARRFDPNRGVSFVTFLYYHLKGNLVRAIDTSVWNSVIPTVAEGMPLDSSAKELPFTSQDLVEALASEAVELPEDSLYRNEIVELAQEARLRLDPLEREVIERIYIKGQQLIDVASTLGYSRCHISRIKKRALLFLHRELRDGVEYAGYGLGLTEDL
jgi:RNA polymerase sigma factor (sigma-70 family)